MNRVRRGQIGFLLAGLVGSGCAAARTPRPAVEIGGGVVRTQYNEEPAAISEPRPDRAELPNARLTVPAAADTSDAADTGQSASIGDLPTIEGGGAYPLELFLERALAENRTVQAARHNVLSLRYRFPQVTVLEDPVVSNVIFPIPSVAPQYSMMGYNPYNVTLAQQYPWFGTLRLRGEVADGDVRVALAELAAAQLDAIAAVKRAYYSLYEAQKTDEILERNREILEDFQEVARERLATGGSQQDVIRAETMISELDRNRAENTQAVAMARSALARQVHAHPGTEFGTTAELSLESVPIAFEQLQDLALSNRPELTGRLAAVDRDQAAVELAAKRFFPNVTLGLTYMNMERTNAMSPTADGMPNVGFLMAFNLPVYRDKYRAGVCEAQQRTLADARLYEAERDETATEIQDAVVQVKTQQGILTLLRDSIGPRTRETFELARSDYGTGNVDYATVQSALREELQVELQIAQTEAELGRAISLLERAVGSGLMVPGSMVTPPDPVGSDPVPAVPEQPPAARGANPFGVSLAPPSAAGGRELLNLEPEPSVIRTSLHGRAH